MIAKHIVGAILNDTRNREIWFEPFVGGGNVLERAAPHFGLSIALDSHQDLILMWRAVMDGWTPPDFISREQYAQLRREEPSAIRGYAGFGASFGGKWFGGYGSTKTDRKHPNSEVCRSSHDVVVRQGSIFRKENVHFINDRFGNVTPPRESVVYCDPPYAGTTRYSTGDFNHESFYMTLCAWSDSGCFVYVSGYSMPNNVPHKVIWSKKKRNTLEKDDNSRTTTEKLFRITGNEEQS